MALSDDIKSALEESSRRNFLRIGRDSDGKKSAETNNLLRENLKETKEIKNFMSKQTSIASSTYKVLSDTNKSIKSLSVEVSKLLQSIPNISNRVQGRGQLTDLLGEAGKSQAVSDTLQRVLRYIDQTIQMSQFGNGGLMRLGMPGGMQQNSAIINAIREMSYSVGSQVSNAVEDLKDFLDKQAKKANKVYVASTKDTAKMRKHLEANFIKLMTEVKKLDAISTNIGKIDSNVDHIKNNPPAITVTPTANAPSINIDLSTVEGSLNTISTSLSGIDSKIDQAINAATAAASTTPANSNEEKFFKQLEEIKNILEETVEYQKNNEILQEKIQNNTFWTYHSLTDHQSSPLLQSVSELNENLKDGYAILQHREQKAIGRHVELRSMLRKALERAPAGTNNTPDQQQDFVELPGTEENKNMSQEERQRKQNDKLKRSILAQNLTTAFLGGAQAEGKVDKNDAKQVEEYKNSIRNFIEDALKDILPNDISDKKLSEVSVKSPFVDSIHTKILEKLRAYNNMSEFTPRTDKFGIPLPNNNIENPKNNVETVNDILEELFSRLHAIKEEFDIDNPFLQQLSKSIADQAEKVTDAIDKYNKFRIAEQDSFEESEMPSIMPSNLIEDLVKNRFEIFDTMYRELEQKYKDYASGRQVSPEVTPVEEIVKNIPKRFSGGLADDSSIIAAKSPKEFGIDNKLLQVSPEEGIASIPAVRNLIGQYGRDGAETILRTGKIPKERKFAGGLQYGTTFLESNKVSDKSSSKRLERAYEDAKRDANRIIKLFEDLLKIETASNKILSTMGSSGNGDITGASSSGSIIGDTLGLAGDFLGNSSAEKSVGKTVGKEAANKGVSGLAKFAGKAGKFIPGIGLAVSAGSAVLDGVDGYNNAENILGIKDRKATFGEKIGAGAASALSGATFGLWDTKSIADTFGLTEKEIITPKNTSAALVDITEKSNEDYMKMERENNNRPISVVNNSPVINNTTTSIGGGGGGGGGSTPVRPQEPTLSDLRWMDRITMSHTRFA